MSENECLIHAPVEAVFAILTDGWTYAGWVVGASRVRDVEAGFPQPGHSIHHSVGVWPLVIDDSTSSEQYEPNRFLQLNVRAWPTGEGQVEFVATEQDGGCHLTMRETAVKGPVTLIPAAVLDPILRARNNETLRRLKLLAEKQVR
ncbi:activator of Hsp90 ATPase-like protein [Kribbella amoyensis]|uniref:Activator of Hsp90 ATPase-like protein n=1 Tax=Kribbella amoyensis TaxID=996641 RepID=A0A561BUA3_9ACTN|nr:SRPBCC family protein [Kribbella amoyensis]TWD82466.1 activator of Hsp90 ATPase-like protein [Kribbella amoyensis]